MKSKLIVALDVDGYAPAVALIEDLLGAVGIFKVGSQLFTRVGPKIVEYIHERGGHCFLDLKFHDIPNTVAKAVESAAALRVSWLTIHASGGAEMLKAAATPIPHRPRLLGVTVLTSVGGVVGNEVVRLARLCRECGLDGVVASAQELALIREAVGKELLIVTPGIRPVWSETGDQKRITTPAQAVAAGADYLVVGRPIVAAADPRAAALRITEEMAGAVRRPEVSGPRTEGRGR